MLQRVNEGQDGTRGHLMYGSCPGLNAAEAFQRASVDVQGRAELALCGSSAGGYRFECWQRHKPDRFVAADARAAGDGVDGASGGCASQKGARLGASATSVKGDLQDCAVHAALLYRIGRMKRLPHHKCTCI